MHRTGSPALLLGVFLLMSTSAIAASAGSLTDRVREATLANGLTVLVLPVRKAPVVTVQIWYRVGSRNEQLGKTGLSHLLEHLMFKATEKLEPEEFSRIIQANGGEFNAFTSNDHTTYFETLSSDRLELALELEADRMANLKLDAETIEPEKLVVMEERRLRSVDNPWGALYEEAAAAAYRAHPYGWPVIGWMKDIESTRVEDLQSHYRTYYSPNNAMVVIAGNVEADDAIALVKKHFESIPAASPPPPVIAEEPPQLGERRIRVHKEANLASFLWMYHVPNVNHADSMALEVLTTILSGGDSSRLYRKLVVEKRLLLDVGTDNPFLSVDTGTFSVSGQVLPGKDVSEAETAIEAELEAIRSEPVGERELRKAKNQIEAEFVFAQDSNFYQAMLLGRFEMVGDWRGLDRYLDGIEAVTAEDVRRVAATYLVPKRRTVAILVPHGADGEPDSSGPAGAPPS